MPSPCPSPTPTTTSSSKAEEDSGGNPGRGLNGVSNLPSQIGNPVLYDMDSQSTEVGREIKGEVSRGTKRRRNSSDSLDEDDDDGASKKRRESTETSPDTSRDESGYQSDSSQHEMFHPAFRGTTCSTNTNSEILAAPASSGISGIGTCTAGPTGAIVGPGQTMEIDQITSLVSIFSFGQHIMAAAAAASSSSAVAGSHSVSITNTNNKSSCGPKPEGEADEEEEEKKEKKSESSEDSDSESDTSSDSGHSSDDHEAAKEEEQTSVASAVASTKLTRSVSTPDLCATSAAAVAAASNTMASEAPPCVEVASL